MNESSTFSHLVTEAVTETYPVINDTSGLTPHSCNGAINDIPYAPVNLTLLGIFTTTVLLQWNTSCSDVDTGNQPTSFAIHVNPLTSDWTSDADLIPFIVTRISADVRQYKLKNLLPETLYNVYIIAANTFGSSNNSDVLTFRTMPATSIEYHKLVVKPVEVILVFGILTAWFMTIVVFLRKWGTIRISQPGGHSKYHQPKNLDTIKVVNTANDSVIYRNYGQDYQRTMKARQKHLDKMHTGQKRVTLETIPAKPTKYKPNNASFQRSAMVEKALIENHPKPGLGHFKPLMPPGMKLKPRLNTKVANIEIADHVMAMFPENPFEQSDREESLEVTQVSKTSEGNLLQISKEGEHTEVYDSSGLKPAENQTAECSSELSEVSNGEVDLDILNVECKQDKESCQQQMLNHDSIPDADQSNGDTIQFKQTSNNGDCLEEICKSTTV